MTSCVMGYGQAEDEVLEEEQAVVHDEPVYNSGIVVGFIGAGVMAICLWGIAQAVGAPGR